MEKKIHSVYIQLIFNILRLKILLLAYFKYVHFHGSKLKFFWVLWQKNLNVSASAQRILTQRPDLQRLLNSTNYGIT